MKGGVGIKRWHRNDIRRRGSCDTRDALLSPRIPGANCINAKTDTYVSGVAASYLRDCALNRSFFCVDGEGKEYFGLSATDDACRLNEAPLRPS